MSDEVIVIETDASLTAVNQQLEVWEIITASNDYEIVAQGDDTVIFFTDDAVSIIAVQDVGPKGDPGDAANALKDPVFTYNTGGDLTRVDYQGGSYKAFTYDSNGNLSQLEYLTNGMSGVRTFIYVNDVLQRIED